MQFRSYSVLSSEGRLQQQNSLISIDRSICSSHNPNYQNIDNIQLEQLINQQNQKQRQFQVHSQGNLFDQPIKSSTDFDNLRFCGTKKIQNNEFQQASQTQQYNMTFQRQMIESITTNLNRVQLRLGPRSRVQLPDEDIDEISQQSRSFFHESNNINLLENSEIFQNILIGRLNEEVQQNYKKQKLIKAMQYFVDIPLEKYQNKLQQTQRCSICLINYEKQQQIISLKCHHIYHKNCLRQWIQRDNRCPLCKRSITDQQ